MIVKDFRSGSATVALEAESMRFLPYPAYLLSFPVTLGFALHLDL